MIDHYLDRKIPGYIDLPWSRESNIFDDDYDKHFAMARTVRRKIQALGIYALVAQDWVNEMAVGWIQGRRCLEVMAGTGVLTKALRNVGVDVVATDDMSWAIKHRFVNDIQKYDARHATHVFKDRDILIMCWPPQWDSVAYHCLQRWKGKPVIYIGETSCGCTADDKFHEHYKIDDEIEIPRYYTFTDSAYIGEHQ